MFILYNLVFFIVALVYLPVYLLRRKFHRGFWRRFGLLPRDLKLDRPIWVHAVSVGETMAMRGLVENLRKSYPEKKFVISTVTATGNKIARGFAQEGDFVTYLPFDFSFIVRAVINRINPSLFIIAETEFWPNLITYLYKKKIPVIVVNGRISDRSLGSYKAVKFLVKPLLDKIGLFCAQTERDKERLLQLGASGDKIRVTGNMKFDANDHTGLKSDSSNLRQELGLTAEDKLLVAGSTHPGEEEIILAAHKRLSAQFPRLRLLLAPRHPERAGDVAEKISLYGFKPVLISQGKTQCLSCIPRSVFILDVMGALFDYYALADIVFVGGSLIKKGGHNILEPASLAKPVLFGPQMFNFRDIAGLFLENNACVLVRDEDEISRAVADLLDHPQKMRQLGEKALALIARNRGATTSNCALIKKYV